MAGKADGPGDRSRTHSGSGASDSQPEQQARPKSPLSIPAGQKSSEQLAAENRRLQQAIDLLRDTCDEAARLLSGCPVAMVFVDNQLRLRHFTPMAGELLGLAETDLGRRFDMQQGPGRSLGLCADLRSVLDSGKQLSSEVCTERGQWLVKHVRCVRGDEGQIQGAVATFQDQTRRVQREKELRGDLQVHQSLLHCLPSPVVWIDAGGQYAGCNGAFAEEILGMAGPHEHMPRPEEIRERMCDELARCLDRFRAEVDAGRDEAQVSVPQADGTTREVRLRHASVIDRKGEVRGRIFLLHDVSGDIALRRRLQEQVTNLEQAMESRTSRLEQQLHQRRAEEAQLRRSEQRFRAIADYAYDWEHWCSPEGKLLWVNPAVERLTGYSPAECMDMEDYPLPIVDPADRPRMRNVYRQAVEWGTSGNDVLFRGRRKDGEPRWFSASWLPIYDASHQCLGHRGSFRDVTQRVHTQQQRDRLEAQVRQAHRFESTGMLAATIAHDFNNILTTILGNAQLGMVDVEEGSSAAACFDEILTAGNRAVELCTQLQNVSGKGRLKVAPTPLEDLVWAACDQASDRLGGPIRPAVSIPADLPPCPCDPAQVQRMLCHLLINAAEAGSNGQADVEVFAGRPDPSAELPLTWRSEPMEQQELVYLEVRDDGCGMDAETLERAFDPFFTTKPGGRGLGLSIALGVVRAHRGGVWVDSAVDGGTTFRVYLPLSGPDRR